MAYLGREPTYGAFERQSLTADGSTVTYTLDYTVASTSSILVSVAGVIQEPNSAYNLASGGTQITFTEAPASGETVFLIYLGIAYEGAIVGQASFTAFDELAERAATTDRFLVYDLSATQVKWIKTENIVKATTQRDYTGDGSTTTFTVSSGVSEDNLLVMNEGLVLLPGTDYTVSGTTLTLTTAPSANDKIDIRELPA
jgi:hypothetical protein